MNKSLLIHLSLPHFIIQSKVENYFILTYKSRGFRRFLNMGQMVEIHVCFLMGFYW